MCISVASWFRGEKVHTNTCAQNYKFTGLERDAESGLDDTLVRKYSSNLGRWLSPDSLAGDIFDPQSLNRYSYALNDPTSLADPLGLCPKGWICVTSTAPSDPYLDEFFFTALGIGTGFFNVNEADVRDATTELKGGRSHSGLADLLNAAQQRVKIDLQKPNCAKDFQDVGKTLKELNNKVRFKDLGPLAYSYVNGVFSRNPGTEEAGTDPGVFSTSIDLNTEVNWANPNDTQATRNGQPWVYPMLSYYGPLLGTSSLTAGQFMDFVLVHELAHYDSVPSLGNVDSTECSQKLWNDCIK